MDTKHGTIAVVLVAALAGATGCGARSGPSGEVPEVPSAGVSAATSSADAGSTEAPPAEEAVITVEDFAYEMPPSVAPGATVTVINEGDATHTVTAREEGTFEAVVIGGGTSTFIAPEEPGAYPVVCAYHPEMSGTLIVE